MFIFVAIKNNLSIYQPICTKYDKGLRLVNSHYNTEIGLDSWQLSDKHNSKSHTNMKNWNSAFYLPFVQETFSDSKFVFGVLQLNQAATEVWYRPILDSFMLFIWE